MAKFLLIPKESLSSRGVIDDESPDSFRHPGRFFEQYTALAETDNLFKDLAKRVGQISAHRDYENPVEVIPPLRRKFLPSRPDPDQLDMKVFEYPGISILNGGNEDLGKIVDGVSDDFYVLNLEQSLDLIMPANLDKNKWDPVNDEKATSQIQWHLNETGIMRARTTGKIGTGKGIIVAVFDTGIEKKHQELKGKVRHTFDRLGNLNPVGNDQLGHGTMVASLICGKTLGAAPDAELDDFAVQTRERGKAELGDFITGLLCLQKDISIVNISGGLHHQSDDHAFRAFFGKFPNIICVAASGNEKPGHALSPGTVDEVVTVGAAQLNYENNHPVIQLWKRSGSMTICQGENPPYSIPDLIAPGVNITVASKNGGYVVDTGTSLAAPIVSGVIASLIEKMENRFESYQKKDVINELFTYCDKIDANDTFQGHGFLSFN